MDKEIYIKWTEDMLIAIDKMTLEEIKEKMGEITQREFYLKRVYHALQQRYDTLSGRKG